jgi:3' terminal RNA ribose 2'-O-methyltransferase Hen1
MPQQSEPIEEKTILSEESIEKGLNLNEMRLKAVFEEIKISGAQNVIDLGCGEGKLLKMLLSDRQFHNITGMDVSIRSLEAAGENLRLDRLPAMQRQRLQLMHGSLMYRDIRFEKFDAASVVEVIEHLDSARLKAFERVVFEFAKPGTLIITTPNREYNVIWESLPALAFRHKDHRFEWTRDEFRQWALDNAKKYGYQAHFKSIGIDKEGIGSPTQMAVFTRENAQCVVG